MQIFIGFFDPVALVLVWFGSIFIVGLQEGASGFRQAFVAWPVLLRADPAQDAQLARQMLHRVEGVLDVKGLQCVDQVNGHSGYVSRALAQLAGSSDLRVFSHWASCDLDDREARHNSVIRFWLAVADVAPAIGMAGTIIGLIRMFGNIADPAKLGAAMALALLTTLYGLIIANVIAAPMSQRFLRLSTEELKWQRILSDRLLSLAQQEIREDSISKKRITE